MKKIILTLMSVTIFALSADYGANANSIPAEERTKLKAPLYNLFKTTDWPVFLREFQISFSLGFCGEGLDKAVGLKAHMIEPVGYFENNKKPLYFPFADLDLGGNIIKSGHTRGTITSEAGRDEFVWSHFIYFPLFGIIFKKKMPVFCFARGDLALPLINEFMPPYSKDIMFKNMIGQMTFMFTPQGLLSTVLNCAATEGGEILNNGGTQPNGTTIDTKAPIVTDTINQEGLAEKGDEYLKFVRNSMYFSVGCLGFAPVGGYVESQDPGTDTELLMYQSINLLHGASTVLPAPFLLKQTNFGMNGGTNNGIQVEDTMCAPTKYPMGIESQYVPQRAFPTVGAAHELGASGITTTSAANVPGSKDSFVNVVWQRRDYYAFAYFCPGGD